MNFIDSFNSWTLLSLLFSVAVFNFTKTSHFKSHSQRSGILYSNSPSPLSRLDFSWSDLQKKIKININRIAEREPLVGCFVCAASANEMKCFNFYIGERKEEARAPKPNSGVVPRKSERSSNLRVFTLSELKQITKNFSNSAKLGEGGFGCVFKGLIKDSEDPAKRTVVAIKQLGKQGHQGHKEWMTEVDVLGVVEHPNLVKLIGYCAEDDERGMQRLLVYEYMPNGSVEDHLSSSAEALPWEMRLRVALDAARGLAYLHEQMDFQIIFRDFKSSNILLDHDWNAKLSDFGFARLGPPEGRTHVSTKVVGTMGYAAPEYVRTGHLTSKSDVWSYGVFLYELITGRRPLERNRPKKEQKLLEWVKPYLSDVNKFEQILDPRLQRKPILKSAIKLSIVANRCLVRASKTRPKMSEVAAMVEEVVIDATLKPKPKTKNT